MPKFGIDIPRSELDHSHESPDSFLQEEKMVKRICETAVCLGLLADGEPLPPDVGVARFDGVHAVNFEVTFPDRTN